MKDTGKGSLAGKQSTCSSRKSLRADKVISDSHEAAQLTAPLVLQDKKAVLAAAWVGVDRKGKGRGACGSLGSLGPELGKLPSSHFFIGLAG